MASARKTVIFERWPKGWSRYNFPGSGVLLPRAVEAGQLMDAMGVEFRPDGSVYWRRDQFIIPVNGDLVGMNRTSKKPLIIQEYTGGGNNQVLILCSDGKLYKLETDWPNATPTQTTEGYYLDFDSETWTEEQDALDTDPDYAMAASREILMVGHPDQATKRWDGTDLTDVGIAAPEDAPDLGAMGGDMEDQDFTTWDETDPNARLTVIAAKVTAAAITRNEDARLVLDLGDGNTLGDFEHRFEFQVTAADVDAACWIWGATVYAEGNLYDITQSPYPRGCGVQFYRDGDGYHIRLGLTHLFGIWKGFSWADDEVDIATGTPYYLTVRRQGSDLRCEVYSDATRETLVGSSSRADGHYAGRWLYAFCSDDAGSNETVSCFVQNLAFAQDISSPGPLSAGTYSYYYSYYDGEFESMPSPILDVHVTSEDGVAIPLISLPDRTVQAQTKPLYRAFTPDTDADARGADFHWVADIDADVTEYLDDTLPASLGETIAFDHALPPRGGAMAWHQDRMYMTRLSCTSRSYDDYETSGIGNMLAYSEIDEPYYWPAQNIIRIGDDSAIVALHSWRHWLLVLKEHSLWALTGYDPDSDFTVTLLDPDIGIANKGAVASGPRGVVWKSSQGIMFWDGGTIRSIYDYRFLPTSPALDEDYPTVCFHRGRFYILQDLKILTWDPDGDTWGIMPGRVRTLGIQNFDFGRQQSHILTTMLWKSMLDEGDPGELIALHTNRAFANYNGAGSTYSDYYAAVEVTLPPLIAPPGMVVQPLEVWIDGSWTHVEDEDTHVKLYLNTSANYATHPWGEGAATAEDAPQGGDTIGIPGGTAAGVVYIQLKGEYAKDFELNAVGVVYVVRKAKG